MSPRRVRVTLVIAAAVLPVFVAAAVLVRAGVVRMPRSSPAAASVAQATPTAGTTRAATPTPQPGAPAARSGTRATPSPRAAPAPFYGQQWLAAHPQPPLPVHARGAVLADLDSHQVLWASEPQLPLPPASLTKTMTAELALHYATLDTVITVPQAATTVQPTTMGLSPGERLTVRELLDGIFLLSANDAAEALAQGIIPRDRFLAEMNQLARSWGLTSTFTNPSGLDDGGLRASAQDLAVIVGHLEQEHPEVLQISAAPQVNLPQSPAHKGYQLSSVVGLITRAYPGATGLKTGFTDDAGYCLIGTATRGTRHLIAVVLNSDTDINDAISLLDYGFATPPPPPG